MLNMLFFIAVGWVLSILFPIPYLNQWIIDLYNAFWIYVKSKTTTTTK